MTAEWMSVALIALTKCINLIFPQIGKQFFSGWNGLVFLMFFWIFTFLWYTTPVYFLEVSLGVHFWKIVGLKRGYYLRTEVRGDFNIHGTKKC